MPSWRLRQRVFGLSPPHIGLGVRFRGEHVAGDGGPFRELFDELCRELMVPLSLLQFTRYI